VSRETRTVRPFRTGALEKSLDGVRLRFGEHECEPASSIFVADPVTFARNRGEIVWAEPEGFTDFKRRLTRGVERLDLNPSAVGLLVTASTTFIRRTEIVLECPLGDLDSLKRVALLTRSERPIALRTGFHGAVVEVYLLLLQRLPERPLQPWRKGTWLARAKFRINVDQGAALFRLTPLDNEQRELLGIPPKAVRYVDLDDFDVLEDLSNSSPPPFYVDEECLTQLSVRQSSPVGVALQGQFVHDFIAAVLWHSALYATDLEIESRHWDDVEDSLLGRVLRFAAGPGASEENLQILLKQVCSRPEHVLAKAEHAIDLGRHLLAGLEAQS